MKVLAALYLTLDVDLVQPDQREIRDDVIEWVQRVLWSLEDEIAGRLLEASLSDLAFDPEARVESASVNVASVLPLRDVLFPGWTYDYPADAEEQGWQMRPIIEDLLKQPPVSGADQEVTQRDPEG